MKEMKKVLLLLTLLVTAGAANAQTYDTLSNFGAYWKYLDDGSDQGATGWQNLTFNDASWSCGPSPLGYGDTWMATCIHAGCTTQTNCYLPSGCSVNATDYFRRKINVPAAGLYDSVVIDGMVDDGLALYVNGTLAWAYGLTAGSFTYTTFTSTSITGGAETTLVATTIPITGFVNGDNQIAVELHQRAANSSDATLDLRFAFHRTGTANVANVVTGEQSITVYPNPASGSLTIADQSGKLAGETFTATIMDMSGRAVFTQSGAFAGSQSTINYNLEAGMYIVKLTGSNINATYHIAFPTPINNWRV
ncbi:MAG: T9SS C-terminal target domain-containing protein [Chitinophagia bacterium]|nr:T9SS C-terminal target domain-containing protein [Chitinophagia bacterium]